MARAEVEKLEDCGDTVRVRCQCGNAFWCDAYGENVYRHEDGDQRPLCPACGTEGPWPHNEKEKAGG